MLLAEAGAEFSEQKVMDIIYRKQPHDARWLDLLIHKKCSLDVTNSKYKDTPLHFAAFQNDLDRLLKLLAIDAKPINASNNEERTALRYAIEKQNIKMIDALMSHQASLGCDEEDIFKLIKIKIDSKDPSERYAALSCLNELHVRTKNVKYKNLLIEIGFSVEKEFADCFEFKKEEDKPSQELMPSTPQVQVADSSIAKDIVFNQIFPFLFFCVDKSKLKNEAKQNQTAVFHSRLG